MSQLSSLIELSDKEPLKISDKEPNDCERFDFICSLVWLLVACNAEMQVCPVAQLYLCFDELPNLPESSPSHSLYIHGHQMDIFKKVVLIQLELYVLDHAIEHSLRHEV